MSAPVLAIEGLCKRFGGLVVADSIALGVEAGTCHAVIGPNGAGKTTLVNQISGLLAPDSGTIRFAGRDVTALGAAARARLGLARTFQISSVIGGFTAAENIALALRARSGSALSPARDAADIAARTRRLLAEVGLEGMGSSLTAALSHGERRALELAVALALDPQLLVLDEPLAGMGREESRAMIDLLTGLKARTAMLLIEHDMDAVFRLADRVSVLVSGTVIASGPPEAIRTDAAVKAAYLGQEEAS